MTAISQEFWVQELWPYVVLVVAGFLPNEVWRMLGLFLSRGIDEGSDFLTWVRAVATAVLAGVVGKLIIFPSGALAGVPMQVRVAAAAIGLAIFFITRRSVLAGVITGVGALMAGGWWSGLG